MMKVLVALATVPVLVACGGAAEPPKAPDTATAAEKAVPENAARSTESAAASSTEAKAEEPKAASPAEEGMPKRCAEGSSDAVCLPPAYLARGLCNEDFPTVALAMFAKGTPWTRAYSMTTSAAWNASGGASSNEKMGMYEELVILRKRGGDTGGIQVSGVGNSFDALRWDGSCVTLQEGELAFQRPPKITSARVVLKRIELHVRDALKDAEPLAKLYQAHRKECKGVTMGKVSRECEKLDGQLSAAVAVYVREQGGLPEPHKLPKRK
ncbi:MAG: hypothetical protein FJ096_16720 [Deltaproteobacteria bacterium]|nr:hypothetical protein [Deltaproteobacteria bacterium]